MVVNAFFVALAGVSPIGVVVVTGTRSLSVPPHVTAINHRPDHPQGPYPVRFPTISSALARG